MDTGSRERGLALDVAAGPSRGPRVQDPPAQRVPASDTWVEGPSDARGRARRRPFYRRRCLDRQRLQWRVTGLDNGS